MKVKKKERGNFYLLKRAGEEGVIPSGNVDEIFNAVMNREQQGSTGIGNGIATPHCRTDLVSHGTIIAATFPSGIKYNSIDNKPVNILFYSFFPVVKIKNIFKFSQNPPVF